MRDTRRAQFIVQTIDSDAIIARDGIRYGLSEILSVERRRFSGVKTGFLVGGIVEGVLFLSGLAAAATAGFGGG